jgi:LysM repeat protein
MPPRDKHRSPSSLVAFALPLTRMNAVRVSLSAVLIACALTGCNRMITPRSSQLVKDADTRAADGDFIHAINLYESALDGSSGAADIHYKLALLYDDKVKEPLSALHHFKRYLTLAPNGTHAAEAKNFMKRDELALVTSMSGDAVVSRGEAARLKNENLRLQKELEERSTQARLAAANEKSAAKTGGKSGASTSKSGPRSHVVDKGDTLFSLSRQYYGSANRWKDIRNANRKKLDSSGKLKEGQTLTIP